MSNADYLIFVILINDTNVGFAGAGTNCDYDSETNRPVAGFFIYNLFNL